MVENGDRLVGMKELLLKHDDGRALIDVCRHNIEAIADANCLTVLAPSPYGDSRVMRYAHGEWKLQVVPNVQETLEAADGDGECIVFDADGKMTRSTMDKLKKNGYGLNRLSASVRIWTQQQVMRRG